MQHVGARQGMFADAPRHLLDGDAAVAALDPAHAVEQHHGEAPDRDELEATRQLGLIVAGGWFGATRADRLGAAARTHFDLDGVVRLDQTRTGVDKSGKMVAGIEHTGDQHGEGTARS